MTAKVKYYLSNAGRKAHLIAGGNGIRNQEITVPVAPENIDLFDLASNGSLSATLEKGSEPILNYDGTQTYEQWKDAEYDAAPDVPSELRRRAAARADAKEKIAADLAARKAAKDAAETAMKREAIALLADPATKVSLQWGDKSISVQCKVQSVVLGADDAPEVASRIAQLIAERDLKTREEALLSRVKALCAEAPELRPTKRLANGLYEFEVPVSQGSSEWAKRLESIDNGARDGYAFCGPWLKVGSTETAEAGELVICGSKSTGGSRKYPTYTAYKELYLVTAAGLLLISSVEEKAKSKAIEYLALTAAERIEKILTKTIAACDRRVASLDALDAAKFALVANAIEERRKGNNELKALCERTLAGQTGEDAEIMDIDSAAAAIVAAGFRALSKTHHPDAGGSAETMALISQARAQLRDLLKLAVAGVR